MAHSSSLASSGRPPYVRFEYRVVEDREASIAAGHYVPRDVAYAVVMPSGSRDETDHVAEEWIVKIKDQASRGFYPPEWAEAFGNYFKAWKEGQEIPLSGFSVRNWAAISRAEAEMLITANVRTVEDLAEANDVACARIGLGGGALKRKAIEWLKSAQDTGKVAEEISSIKAMLEDLKAENDRLSRDNAELSKQAAGVRDLRPNRK